MNEYYPHLATIAANEYKLEATDQGPTLRLYIDGKRSSAYILVEAENEPGQYLRLDMPDDDRAELAGWFEAKQCPEI